MVNWHARAPQRPHVAKAARKRARRRHEVRCCCCLCGERRGVEHGRDVGPHGAILRGDEIEERRAAAEDDPPADQAAMLLQQNLRAAEREHARQRPSWYRKHTVSGAGRQNEHVEIDRIGGA